jgi:PhzF family phenazine biosynthesis protein
MDMNPTLFVVDAFTNQAFRGNPAAVCILERAADETWMKNVAREMNLAETAFVVPQGDAFHLRWLTPKVEVDLCGHATLAAAHVLWHSERALFDRSIRFSTRSGPLICNRQNDWIEMDFPALSPHSIAIPEGMGRALGTDVDTVMDTGMDYLVELASEALVRGLDLDYRAIAQLPTRGLIVTARSDSPEFDIVSRFFAPACGIDEDPVTGSAHCALGPYWAAKLNKATLLGYQASERGGTVRMQVRGERIALSGQSVLMSRVELMH